MSSPVSSIMKTGGVQDTPLLLFQPFNLVVFLSFYSPIILAISVLGMSFVFQNFKGFIYLGFLLAACVARELSYKYIGKSNQTINDNTICTSIQYTKYGNPSFSAFIFAFTIMYLSLPMFSNDSVNFWIFSVLLAYFFIDMFIKIYKKCVVNMGDLFLNVLLGLSSSALFVTLMYAGGSGKYMFFNEVSSTKEMCSQPKKQTFKCSLYKDGSLVGSI
jgi:hypothetical protein